MWRFGRMLYARMFFVLAGALCLTGCIVVVQAPPTATPLRPLVTRVRPTAIAASASPTASRLPTPLPTFTPLASSPPLSITAFSVFPATIRPGEVLTLTWLVTAERVTLTQLGPDAQPSEVWEAPLFGTLEITRTATLSQTVEFVLWAYSGTASAQAFGSAQVLCPDSWFVTPPPPACPASPPIPTLMQAEYFERGVMMWTQWNDTIFVVHEDNLMPHWEQYPNQWFSDMPLNDPTLTAPPDLYQPVRGFGLIWRMEGQAARLGWATEQEFGVDNAHYQCTVGTGVCYLLGPDNIVYELMPNAEWRVWP